MKIESAQLVSYLITRTSSWKALSTFMGGSLALVSIYVIWKAKQKQTIIPSYWIKQGLQYDPQIKESEVISVCIVLKPVFLSFLSPSNKPIIPSPHASLSVWGAKTCSWFIFSSGSIENVSFWCTIIYNTKHLLLSCTHEWKYSYFRLSTCSDRTKGNLILTLCFAAISWPCSELTFLRWTKSTLFATSTIGKASLRGSHRQKPEQHIFNSHPGG